MDDCCDWKCASRIRSVGADEKSCKLEARDLREDELTLEEVVLEEEVADESDPASIFGDRRV